MKRYDLFCSYDGGGPAEEQESPDGGWVRYDDAVAAVAAEREQCAKMIEDYESAGWHGGSGYHAGLKCAVRLLRA